MYQDSIINCFPMSLEEREEKISNIKIIIIIIIYGLYVVHDNLNNFSERHKPTKLAFDPIKIDFFLFLFLFVERSMVTQANHLCIYIFFMCVE
jgi:hypothetical protein